MEENKLSIKEKDYAILAKIQKIIVIILLPFSLFALIGFLTNSSLGMMLFAIVPFLFNLTVGLALIIYNIFCFIYSFCLPEEFKKYKISLMRFFLFFTIETLILLYFLHYTFSQIHF